MKNEKSHNTNETFLAQWLEGELSDSELKELVSVSDYKSYLKIRKGLEVYDHLESSTDSSYAKIQEQINQHKGKVRRLHVKTWLLGIAASIVLSLGLFSILGDDLVTIETNFGEQKIVALVDGSEVVLNSKSSLTYDEDSWKKNRTISLNGEAYFKVKKGSTFTVVTDNGDVQVLGTQFNVNSVSDLFEVVCFEGKVIVKTKDESYMLFPTNSVRRINGDVVEKWDISDSGPSWINGESSFKSVPLKYVISALESQYNIKIYSESIDTNLIYTGSFTHESLNTALKTVFKSLQIQYFEKEKGNIYLNVN